MGTALATQKRLQLPKAPTGIEGLDEVTGGGLPRGRPTLVSGRAGCGKTLLAMEFLVRGATQFGEPGVFLAFEETAEELAQNVRSLGFDLKTLIAQKKLVLDYVHIERSEIEETGEYDLDGLFIRLGHAIDTIGAKRVVLDTIENLFGGFSNGAALRSELRRLFRWLKDRGVTAVITGERGDNALTRHGLEEYVSDCVIVLDHRVTDQLSTRRLRIVKYRGTVHGTNEYPFLIGEGGIAVLPITSLGLLHEASRERIPTGIPSLDEMLGGEGVYRGSSVLISGVAGSGKSSVAAHFAAAACRRQERCLYLAFEESASQIVRNMQSIGLELSSLVKKGMLTIHSTRPTAYGLETHLAEVHKLVRDLEPRMVIVDPITNFLRAGSQTETEGMLTRLIDFLKSQQTTAVFTSLTTGGAAEEQSEVGISSLIDTWLLLQNINVGGERNRGMYILKSRGMAHSNRVREFLLSDRGVELVDVYVGPEGVLTGSMRLAQEAREESATLGRQEEIQRRERDLERKRQTLDEGITKQRAQFAEEEKELKLLVAQERASAGRLTDSHKRLAGGRKADGGTTSASSSRRNGNQRSRP